MEPMVRAPGQRIDDRIRPDVLFDQSAAERGAATGAAKRIVYGEVARVGPLGMDRWAPSPEDLARIRRRLVAIKTQPRGVG